jgi:hypothetical protein
METDPVSATSWSLVSRIPEDGKSPKTPSSEPFRILLPSCFSDQDLVHMSHPMRPTYSAHLIIRDMIILNAW